MPREPVAARPGHGAPAGAGPSTDRFPFPSPTAGSSWPWPTTSTPGRSRSLHYFGRDLVLYRGDDGRAPPGRRLLPAPRRPPGRRRQGRGRAASAARSTAGGSTATAARASRSPTASAERIPAKARTRPYPTIERNGMIWAWHHAEEGEPFFDVPVVPEFDDPGWTAPLLQEFTIATSCQEMAENNHDFAHFQYVHGTESIPEATRSSTAPTSGEEPGARARDVRPRARRRPGARHAHLPVVGHPDRRGQRARALDLHRAGRRRRARAPGSSPSSSPAASPRTSRSGRTRSTGRCRC